MKVNFWSDYACPFCWIGEVRMRRALAELGMLENAVLIPRAFELDPGAPATIALNGLATIARRYNMSSGEVQVMFDQIAEQGKADGLVLNQRDTQHANTFNAHRLMKLGLASKDRTLAENLNEDLFAAFFVDNLNLADKDALMAVGQKAGLAEAEIKKLLATDEYATEVRADEDAAARLGIHSVPYFIFENGAAAVGALSVEEFKNLSSLGIYKYIEISLLNAQNNQIHGADSVRPSRGWPQGRALWKYARHIIEHLLICSRRSADDFYLICGDSF